MDPSLSAAIERGAANAVGRLPEVLSTPAQDIPAPPQHEAGRDGASPPHAQAHRHDGQKSMSAADGEEGANDRLLPMPSFREQHAHAIESRSGAHGVGDSSNSIRAERDDGDGLLFVSRSTTATTNTMNTITTTTATMNRLSFSMPLGGGPAHTSGMRPKMAVSFPLPQSPNHLPRSARHASIPRSVGEATQGRGLRRDSRAFSVLSPTTFSISTRDASQTTAPSSSAAPPHGMLSPPRGDEHQPAAQRDTGDRSKTNSIGGHRMASFTSVKQPAPLGEGGQEDRDGHGQGYEPHKRTSHPHHSGKGLGLPPTSRFAKCKKLPSILLDSWEFRKIASEGSVLANALVCFDVDNDGVEECVVGTTEGVLLVVKPDCRTPIFTHVLSATISIVMYSCQHHRLVLVTLEGQCEVLDNFLVPSATAADADADADGADEETDERDDGSHGIGSASSPPLPPSSRAMQRDVSWSQLGTPSPSTTATATPAPAPPPRVTSHTNIAVDLLSPRHDTFSSRGVIKPTSVFHVPSNCFCGDLGQSESGIDRIFLGSYDRRMYVYSVTGVCLLCVFMHSPITSIKPVTWTPDRRAGSGSPRTTSGSHTSSDGAAPAAWPTAAAIPLVFVATTRTLALLRAGTRDFEQLRQQEAKRKHPLTLADADALRLYREANLSSHQLHHNHQQQQSWQSAQRTVPSTGLASVSPGFGKQQPTDWRSPVATSHTNTSQTPLTAVSNATSALGAAAGGVDSFYMISPNSAGAEGGLLTTASPTPLSAAAQPQLFGSAAHPRMVPIGVPPTLDMGEESPLSPLSPQSPSRGAAARGVHARRGDDGGGSSSSHADHAAGAHARHTELSAPVTLVHPLWLVKIAENGILAPPPLAATLHHRQQQQRKEQRDSAQHHQQQRQQDQQQGQRESRRASERVAPSGADEDTFRDTSTRLSHHRSRHTSAVNRRKTSWQLSVVAGDASSPTSSASVVARSDSASTDRSGTPSLTSGSLASSNISRASSSRSDDGARRSRRRHRRCRRHGHGQRSSRRTRDSQELSTRSSTQGGVSGATASAQRTGSAAVATHREKTLRQLQAESVPRSVLRDGSFRPSLAMLARSEEEPPSSVPPTSQETTQPGPLKGVQSVAKRIGRRRNVQRQQQEAAAEGPPPLPAAVARPFYPINLPLSDAPPRLAEERADDALPGNAAFALHMATEGVDPVGAARDATHHSGSPLHFDDSVALSISLDVSTSPQRMLLVASTEDGRAFVLDFSALTLPQLLSSSSSSFSVRHARDEGNNASVTSGGGGGGRPSSATRKQALRIRAAGERGFSGNTNEMYDDMPASSVSRRHQQGGTGVWGSYYSGRGALFTAAGVAEGGDMTPEQVKALARLAKTRKRQHKTAVVLHRCGHMNWDNRAAISPRAGTVVAHPSFEEHVHRSESSEDTQSDTHSRRHRRPCYHIYIPLADSSVSASASASASASHGSRRADRRASQPEALAGGTPVRLGRVGNANGPLVLSFADGRAEMVMRVCCAWAGNLGGTSPLVQRSRILRVAEDGFCAVLVTASGTCVAIDPDTRCAVEYAVLADCSSFTLSVGPPIPVVLPITTTASAPITAPVPTAAVAAAGAGDPLALRESRQASAALSAVRGSAAAPSEGTAPRTVLGRAVSCVCVCVDELSVYSIGDTFLSTVYHQHSLCDTPPQRQSRHPDPTAPHSAGDGTVSTEHHHMSPLSEPSHGPSTPFAPAATGLSPFVLVEGWSRRERDEERRQLQAIGAALMQADGVLTQRQKKLLSLVDQQHKRTIHEVDMAEEERLALEEAELDEQVFYATQVIAKGYSVEEWDTLFAMERAGKVL